MSIFLQEKVQNSDGTFKIFIGGPVIAGGDIPGMKRIYDKNDNLIQVANCYLYKNMEKNSHLCK